MLERISDGFLGLFLFFSQWLSPQLGSGDIKVIAVDQSQSAYSVQCAIDITLNGQMNDCIDAGIPLRFHIFTCSDKGDTMHIIRTLRCNISNYTYQICDSVHQKPVDSVHTSGVNTHIYKAMRSCLQWTTHFSPDASVLHLHAELLHSFVPQFNRKVDMSQVCGYRFFSKTIQRK